jgi:beta-glucosidase
MTIPPSDVTPIEALTTANPPTIVALVAAGAVIIEKWKENIPSILTGWYARSEGGHALADVLLDKTSPGGHLQFSIPSSEEHLPFFDVNAKKITYDRCTDSTCSTSWAWELRFHSSLDCRTLRL